MRGFLAGDVPGPLWAYVLTWVDWLKTGLNRCKIGHLVGDTGDTANSLYIKKLFLVLASYSRAVLRNLWWFVCVPRSNLGGGGKCRALRASRGFPDKKKNKLDNR